MFEFFKGNEKEAPKIPTFEELTAALPENLREEFKKLAEDIKKIASTKGGAKDGLEIEDEILSDKERGVFARYGELQRTAIEKLQSK